jgi:hypothetical protein
MRAGANETLPLARTDELIVQELPDELLVYDSNRYKAHCLNKASALVWKHCDGKTTVAEMMSLLEKELATVVGEDVVWLALNQLRRFRLLEEEGVAKAGRVKISRRDLVRKYLPAALTLPLIISIAAPAAAQAASGCLGDGVECGGPTDPPCCPGLECVEGSCFPSEIE